MNPINMLLASKWRFVSLGFIVICMGLLLTACTLLGVEREGLVDYSGCKEVIKIDESDEQAKLLKEFTCDFVKTKDGQVMSGICFSLEYNGGACTKAYVYKKSPEITCGSHSNLTYDGCICEQGYEKELFSRGCVKITCPENSTLLGNECECNIAYTKSKDGKLCLQKSYINVYTLDDGALSEAQGQMYHYLQSNNHIEPVEFKGNVSTNCEKIMVNAKHSKEGIDSNHTLSSYEPKDPTFKYHAKLSYGNLGKGMNLYTFTAFCDGDQQEVSATYVVNFN